MTHKQDTKATEVDEAQAAANRFADKASAAISSAAEKDEGKRISYPAIMRRLTGCVREYRAATVATPLLVLGEVACDIEPGELLAALRAACFERSNRFLLPLPLDFGRVRLTAVDDETLSEHVVAWCESRQALLYEDTDGEDAE